MTTVAEISNPRGWSLLDGVTFVTGAAVASVHIRDRVDLLDEPTFFAWIVLGIAFLYVSITAAGPFVFLVRRFGREASGYPAQGDLAWLMLGLPWLCVALARSALGTTGPAEALHRLSPYLFVGIGLSSVFAVVTVARRWLEIRPETEAGPSSKAQRRLATTEAVGLTLAATWPLQIALGLLIVG